MSWCSSCFLQDAVGLYPGADLSHVAVFHGATRRYRFAASPPTFHSATEFEAPKMIWTFINLEPEVSSGI